jgi:hypothetical protein
MDREDLILDEHLGTLDKYRPYSSQHVKIGGDLRSVLKSMFLVTVVCTDGELASCTEIKCDDSL